MIAGRRTLGAVLAAAVAVLSACTDEGNGNGQDPPTQTQVSTPEGAPNGALPEAPKVANPVANLDKFMQSPCDVISKSQAAELGFDAKIAEEPETDQGPACEWENDGSDSFAVLLSKKQPLGIAGLYQNHEQIPDLYKYFEPVDVAGFPGVFQDSFDARPNGACGLSVGVTDQQIIVLTNRVESGDPCDLLRRAAEGAVTTMSKG